jgi:uncharacterized protein (DUF433 family)
VDYRKFITTEPGKRSGQPCIRGMSQEELLEEFPYLTKEDILACFAFAADHERRLKSPPANGV